MANLPPDSTRMSTRYSYVSHKFPRTGSPPYHTKPQGHGPQLIGGCACAHRPAKKLPNYYLLFNHRLRLLFHPVLVQPPSFPPLPQRRNFSSTNRQSVISSPLSNHILITILLPFLLRCARLAGHASHVESIKITLSAAHHSPLTPHHPYQVIAYYPRSMSLVNRLCKSSHWLPRQYCL